MIKKLLLLSLILVFSLTSYSQPKLLGNTMNGGNQFGLIFKYTAGATQFDDTYRLTGIAGMSPGAITQIGNYIYGCTRSGGAFGLGTIYKYEPLTNVYTVLHDFVDSTGSQSSTQLLLASNGKLYGTSGTGGPLFGGVIFEFDLSTNTYQKLAYFGSVINGGNPSDYLIQASNGKLYGTTYQGISNFNGTLFEFDIATNTITTLHNFTPNTGNNPGGKLFETQAGKLVGLTFSGGGALGGVIYEYDLNTNTYTKKTDFTTTTGTNPTGSFTALNATTLLGTCSTGGTGAGTLFEYNIATNTLTKKFDFIQAQGSRPMGNLTLASNGKYYGGFENGGASNAGGIFEYTYATNSCIYKHSFTASEATSPRFPFVEFNSGKLMGINTTAGPFLGGVLFEYDFTNNTLTKKLDFQSSDGSKFTGPLTLAANGKYYSGTLQGGINNAGVIFEYDYATNSYTKKIDLSSVTGISSSGSLVHAPNGKLYGTTSDGGVSFQGTLFEYDYTTNTCTKKVDFNSLNGAAPLGSMMLASDGFMYGITSDGGTQNIGVLYQYDYVNNIIVNKFEFNNTSGHSPKGSLMQASNGKLYGMTNLGGTNDYGTLFSYNLNTSTVTKIHDFGNNGTGTNPEGSLLEISPGILLGMTRNGGNGSGTIFEYNFTTGVVTNKYDLILTEGSEPLGTLFKASNGKIFGMTAAGGQYYTGTIFEYDPVSNIYTKKMDLDMGTTGWFPVSTFVEVDCLNPVITASGPLSFCLGDSVTLSANGITGSTFQWYRNGFLIAGATNPTYVAKIPGRYYVSVSDPNCAITSNTPPVRVRVPCIPPPDEGEKQGIAIANENLFMHFSAGSDELSLFTEHPGSCSLLITDAAGRVVLQNNYEGTGTASTRTVSCSTFAKGIYFARLVAGDSIYTMKFFKGL